MAGAVGGVREAAVVVMQKIRVGSVLVLHRSNINIVPLIRLLTFVVVVIVFFTQLYICASTALVLFPFFFFLFLVVVAAGWLFVCFRSRQHGSCFNFPSCGLYLTTF
uniref:Uncharacterized protein n=1 Tax=Trypanosoma congolense (strain IL3000) TaxID=1068625 RepID=G0USX9_TRYCI|nr:hypothetical protein, unlikely [Trypanosoma congolense IL3000]